MKEPHHKNITSQSAELFVYLTLSSGFFLLLVLKAVYVPPTQDEVTSFFSYALGDWSRLLDLVNNNNHILNTLLGKLSMTLFGDTMLVFRLPNVLSYIIWLVAGWRLAGMLTPVLRWPWLISLFLCYPMFEYFALARGYGLSFAFLLFQVYYLIKYQTQPSLKHLWLVSLATILAVFSQLALLNEALITFLVLLLLMIYNKAWSLRSLFPMVVLAVCLALNIKLGLSYKGIVQFFFNQNEGFIQTTIGSLLQMFRDGLDHWSSIFVLGTSFVLALIAAFLLLTRSDWRKIITSPVIMLGVLLFGNVCCSVLLSVLFEVHYPTVRVALYYIPLYLVFVFFGLDILKTNKTWQFALPTISAYLLCGYFLFDFIDYYNASRSRVEPYAHLPESVFEAIYSENKEQASQYSPIISGDERLTHAWRYYVFAHGSTMNNWIDQYDDGVSNYLILNDLSEHKQSIYSSDVDRVSVIKGTTAIPTQTLEVSHKEPQSGDYVDLYSTRSFRSNGQSVSLGCAVQQEQSGRLALYAVLKTQDEVELFSKGAGVDQLLVSTQAEIHPTWVFPECDSCILNIFLHNIDKRTITVSGLSPQTTAP